MTQPQERSEAGTGTSVVPGIAAPIVPPEVPLAAPVPIDPGSTEQPQADAGTESSAAPASIVGPGPLPFKICPPALLNGCYALTYRPANSLVSFEGTLRVDRKAPDPGADNIIVSGDLYRRSSAFPLTDTGPGPVVAAAQNLPENASIAATASQPAVERQVAAPLLRTRIPVFPRSRYHSYLKVISVTEPPIVIPASKSCSITLVVEQYDYTHPPAGSFKGSFPATASRTATITLTRDPAAPPLGAGPRFVGRWVEGGVDKGTVSMSWVSSFFRRASVEVDTLVGAVAPQPVPDGTGGTEYFDTIYAKHGWQLSVVRDQTDVPVPAGVNPTDCWSSANLHALMAGVRNPGTDLDTDWRIHLVVVPARLGCGRGVMYDQIAVPREGCASFSDDGYPKGDSGNFGNAADRTQREIARAYLRSATHELTHTFNQIHQEQETAADNSIMTTTPSVADVLGGPATGEPGVFPDQINLAVNTTVRHHLVHMPDPVIRPGGWPFASWFGTAVPQAADHHQFDPSELELSVTGPSGSVGFGQPLELSWTVKNTSDSTLVVPNNVSLEGLFGSMTIIDADGNRRPYRSFVINCETVRLHELQPGDSVTAKHRVFWSSDGFAFPRPGTYRVEVAVAWSAGGVPVGVQNDTEVFVEYPTSAADNAAAGLVLNAEVGKWVALGGHAYHLTDAADRLNQLADRDDPAADSGTSAVLAGFADLLPDPGRMHG
jgi:hypothetical protein